MTSKLKFIKNEMYEYEEFKLVDSYDPVLKEVLPPYEFKDKQKSKYLAVSLLETMQAYGGVGLAANQCGLRDRLFVMGAEGVGYAFFNPEIVSTDGEDKFEEGCLSFPGLFLPIKRPAVVEIKYFDMYGEEKKETFAGLSARTILHEYDHLQGIIYTKLVSPIILEREKRKVKKNQRLLREQREAYLKRQIIEQATQRVVYEHKKNLEENQEVASNEANSLISKEI